MGRIGNFYPSVERCHVLQMKYFYPTKFFRENKDFKGTLLVSEYWKFEENTIFFTYEAKRKFLRILFFIEGERFEQTIGVVKRKTNLNNGYRYYFFCPNTGKPCIKLYRPPANRRFLHRTAWKNLYYSDQKESKEYRAVTLSKWGLNCQIDALTEKLVWMKPKNQKTHYRGNPTPKYRKLEKLKEKLKTANNDALKNMDGWE